jgi:hypothetical protein
MQLELMRNLGKLNSVWPASDIISLSMQIDKFLKENPDQSGAQETVLDMFTGFLSGDTTVRVI